MADEKILERVRQLLAMAADSSSPHEAAIAAGRARKLMDMYQIDLADLDTNGGFASRSAGEEYRFMPEWQGLLSVGVAILNDCKVVKQHKWKSSNKSYSYQLVFQGHSNDVLCAVSMYEHLETAIKKMCSKYIKDLGYSKYPARIGDPFKKSCSSEIQKRMKAMAAARRADPGLQLAGRPGTSLVVYKMARVEEHFGEAKYTDKNFKISKLDLDVIMASAQGRIAGQTIDINLKLGDS